MSAYKVLTVAIDKADIPGILKDLEMLTTFTENMATDDLFGDLREEITKEGEIL